jgi:hypothetical protein
MITLKDLQSLKEGDGLRYLKDDSTSFKQFSIYRTIKIGADDRLYIMDDTYTYHRLDYRLVFGGYLCNWFERVDDNDVGRVRKTKRG